MSSPDRLTDREKEILARLHEGLSDQQIADELFLSPNTVKWYNRQIYAKLGVSSRAQAVAHARMFGTLHKNNAYEGQLSLTTNLPMYTTSFIGRSREIADIIRLLESSRFLTVTGTGGVGKTRLALAAAKAVSGDFPDGVYFVDLAPLSRHDLVAGAICAALGVMETSTESPLAALKNALNERTLLLLIDNFEHVAPAALLVPELLAASRRLKILITSREALHLAGEQEYSVPPLSLPDPDAASARHVLQSEAGALFVRRVQLVQPSFEVSDETVPAIARICARLDGLPLAIELAAARSKLLTPQALLERLTMSDGGSPLHTLSSGTRDVHPRHRTLSDTMAWSYGLLEEAEKTLFARLAIFRGGRSLEAIEAVCGDNLPIDVLDGLASLVDKSLVQQKETSKGEPRFILLEMIHEYAREQLEASGEAETIRRRHAEYFVTLAERAEPELRLSRYGYWCQRFELELDNLRAVLEWTLGAGDVALGIRLAGALGLFWYGKGYHVEGIRWTRALLERLDETPAMYHAKFLLSAGRMAWMVDLDEATRLFVRAHEVSRALGDDLQAAWALAFQGYTRMHESGTAMALAESSLAMFREMDHQPGIAQALNIIGELARMRGDDKRAKSAYEECLAICQQTGEVLRMCYNYVNLAYIAQHEGDHEHAILLVRRALQLSRDDVEDVRDIASFLVTYSGSIAALGNLQPAAKLLGASEAALERMGAFIQPTDQPEIDRIIEEVRSQLDNAAFQAAWNEGRKMSLQDAVAWALEETH